MVRQKTKIEQESRENRRVRLRVRFEQASNPTAAVAAPPFDKQGQSPLAKAKIRKIR